MRDLVYEYNGKIYKTREEAPKGAIKKLIDSPTEKATYRADRVAKIREKGATKQHPRKENKMEDIKKIYQDLSLKQVLIFCWRGGGRCTQPPRQNSIIPQSSTFVKRKMQKTCTNFNPVICATLPLAKFKKICYNLFTR